MRRVLHICVLWIVLGLGFVDTVPAQEMLLPYDPQIGNGGGFWGTATSTAVGNCCGGLVSFFEDFVPNDRFRGKCTRCCRYDECQANGLCLACTNRSRYWSVFGGWNLIGRQDEFEVLDGSDNPLARGELNSGFIAGGAFGRRIGDHTRAEFELAYRANSGDTLGADPLDGHMNNWSTMFNLYREFKEYSGLTPYLGGGIGLARQNGDFLTEAGQNVDIRDEAFAFQAIAGVAQQVFEGSYLFFEYRYYGNTETDLRVFGVGDVADVQYQSQNFLFGFRWRY